MFYYYCKGLILLIGFPNNKCPPNNKNYLMCLFIGGLVLGGRDFIYIYTVYIYILFVDYVLYF